ncbi:MAG TPA: porin family protein [Segetibacter sp.]
MKKILLVAAAAIITSASFSQVRFGAQVIGNAGTAAIETNEEIENLKKPTQIGFGAGVVADLGISDHFSIRPSLNYLQKKSRVEYQDEDLDGKTFSVNTTLNYLELPVNFVYKIPMNSATAFVGAGPSIGYGISGKMKAKGWIADEDSDDLIEVNESTDAFKKESEGGGELKRIDLSANAIAGIEFKNGLYINAGYLMGLNSLVKEEKYKTRGLTLTLGFMFPGKG